MLLLQHMSRLELLAPHIPPTLTQAQRSSLSRRRHRHTSPELHLSQLARLILLSRQLPVGLSWYPPRVLRSWRRLPELSSLSVLPPLLCRIIGSCDTLKFYIYPPPLFLQVFLWIADYSQSCLRDRWQRGAKSWWTSSIPSLSQGYITWYIRFYDTCVWRGNVGCIGANGVYMLRLTWGDLHFYLPTY